MAGFFDEVDSTGIVEQHIKDVLNLERKDAESMLVGYREIHTDLVQRLNRMPKGSFSAQHLRGVLAQSEGAIEALNRHLAGEMNQSAYRAALKSVEHLTTEIREFDDKFTGAITPINLNAALIARDTQQMLATRYESNLDKYGNDMMQKLQRGLFQASIGEVTADQVVGSMWNFFNAEEWKLHRLVRTELHHVYNLGKMNTMQDLADDQVPDLFKSMIHPLDQRTGEDSKALARENPIIPIDEFFVQVWNGKELVFLCPPNRPNDRAILIPHRKEWGGRDVAAFIPGRYPEA